jgi:hypothetical protein
MRISLSGHCRIRRYRVMDPLCLPAEIPVECTDDDAGVISSTSMQLNKMLAVQCQDGALFAYGKCEDLFVTHGLFRSAGFLNG